MIVETQKGAFQVLKAEGQRKELKGGEKKIMLSEMLTSELEIQKRRLKALMEKKAFLRRSPQKGEKPFELASGGKSYVFFDCKPVTQNPEGISLIAEIIFEMVKDYHLDAIGGIETGSIPICTAVAQLSFLKGKPIPAFWVRHKPKKHGTKNLIEGELKPKSRVVVLDDVTTRGNSIEKAVKAVRAIDCNIVQLITMVDREEGARDKFEKEGLKYTSIFKKSDFQE